MTSYDQGQGGGARLVYDQKFDNNGNNDNGEPEEATDYDWQYSDRVPRGKMATVRQLRKNVASMEHERGRERDQSGHSTHQSVGDIEDPRDENGKDDDIDRSGEFLDRRAGFKLKRRGNSASRSASSH